MDLGEIDEESPRWRAVDRTLAIATAAIFAWGVLYGGWSVFAVMVLFWFENVVIGVFNLAKLLLTGVRMGVGGIIGALFIGAFFTVHYGMFTAVHGVFVVTLFGGGTGKAGDTSGGLFAPLIRMIEWVASDRDGRLALLVIVLMQAIAFVRWARETRVHPPALNALMSAPYGRIMVLHVTLIFGGFIATALKAPVAGALLLIGLKLIYDLVTIRRESAPVEGAEKKRALERVQQLLVIGRRKLDGRP
ncbi:MAG: DUF6498-containing protein [Burkholderiaceae bacterium]